MRAPNVHLLQMRDAAVARRHGDVLELDVHVVFRYKPPFQSAFFLSNNSFAFFRLRRSKGVGQKGLRGGFDFTIEELAAVRLAGCDFKRHDMALHCTAAKKRQQAGSNRTGNRRRRGTGRGRDEMRGVAPGPR